MVSKYRHLRRLVYLDGYRQVLPESIQTGHSRQLWLCSLGIDCVFLPSAESDQVNKERDRGPQLSLAVSPPSFSA